MSGRKLKLRSKAKGAGKGRGKSKESSWQTSINAYFGGKSLPTQPTLQHFIQKQALAPAVDLKNSLDRIDLTNKNENLEPVTAATSIAKNVIVKSCGQSGRGLSVRNFDGGPSTCDQTRDDPCQQKHDVISDLSSHGDGDHGDGCHVNVDSEDPRTTILQGQTLNCLNPTITNEATNPLKLTARDEANIPPCNAEVSLEPRCPLLGEVSAADPGKRSAVNPFAKLECCADASDGHFISKPSARKAANKQGLTHSTARKGLSLRVRKRKFVMSPSKPQQGKPVKQVFQKQQQSDENIAANKCDAISCTPPLFTTHTPSHPHNHTPSLFTPRDKDILQQYSTHTTPCRRLSLADLETAPVALGTVGGAGVGSLANDVIDGARDVTDKSHDEQLLSKKSNFSFSDRDMSNIFDQSLVFNKSHDQCSKSHDPINMSHDLFDQSHDSFDELLKHAPTTDDITAGAYDLNDDIAAGSHDLNDDITTMSHDLTRHLVLERAVQEREEGGRARPEVLLRLLDQGCMQERVVYLRDEWVNIPVSPGDTVQVNPPPEWNRDQWGSPCVIDGSNEGSVIVSPDMLITPTAIATSITCPRRAVLSDLFKGVSKDNIAMVTGSLLHQLFQGVLVQWAESQKREGLTRGGRGVVRDDIDKIVKNVLSSREALNQLFSLGVSDEEALSLLSSLSPSILTWCSRFLHTTPQAGKGDLEFKRTACDSDVSVCVSVDQVHDIEENIWSPRLGLKGKVDATLQIKERRGGQREESSYRVPMEIKTGKMYRKQGSLEHRAQLSLYALMLRDRYHDDKIPGGLLYYMKAGHMQGLPAESHEIRSLLMARNKVAGHYGNLSGHMTLPGMLKDGHVCKFCPYIHQCCLVHKSVEQGTAETSGLGELFTSHTHHLSHDHLHFFREKEGVAMGYMQACQPVRRSEHNSNRHLQKFIRSCNYTPTPPHPHTSTPPHPHTPTPPHPHTPTPPHPHTPTPPHPHTPTPPHPHTPTPPHPHTHTPPHPHTPTPPHPHTHTHTHTLPLNERIVVSRQDGSAWAIVMGTVTMATDVEIELLLDKPVSWDGTAYRLDVAPGYHGSTSLANLARLCSADSERDAQLRRLIIDLCPPRYRTSPISHLTKTTPPATPLRDEICSNLNTSQKSALDKVLCSKDYTLILGRPGTGKTTTIARLVQSLVAMGASVLVTSYTHSAVDNILLKLRDAGVDFLRLGSKHTVHPSLHPYLPCQTPCSTVSDLDTLYQATHVVATTCLGVNHVLFSRRSFDYCIVDEASQLTVPVSLGPLRCAAVFVMVGDHYQLPPLVQSHEARDGGLAVSLFRLLSEHHPNSMVTLDLQYRMNSEIMLLSNTLFYNHELKCGDVGVASGRLLLPHPAGLSEHSPGWLRDAVNPDKPVIFLNTDQLEGSRENCGFGERVWNKTEVEVVTKLVSTLLQCGVPASQVGVVTPYRYQQSQIREALTELTHETTDIASAGQVEVNTIDRYQGRDKECVVVSFARSNPHRNVGNLLCDWRRINVALTRAKHKLVMVGSLTTLPSSPSLLSLSRLLTQQNWITNITNN